MLVCPSCRHENQEESRFCTSCGRSLSPDEVAMVSRSVHEVAEPAIDIPAPKVYSPVPGILTLVAIGLVGIAAATWFALRPNPCEGKFTSEEYPYCVQLPARWNVASVELASGQTLDAFEAPRGGATIYVIATQAEGRDTESFTEESRRQYESDGLLPSPPEPVEVDGTRAFVWRVTDQNQTTGNLVSENRVTLVRDGMSWIITLSGDEQRVSRSLPEFEEMLRTWSWK